MYRRFLQFKKDLLNITFPWMTKVWIFSLISSCFCCHCFYTRSISFSLAFWGWMDSRYHVIAGGIIVVNVIIIIICIIAAEPSSWYGAFFWWFRSSVVITWVKTNKIISISYLDLFFKLLWWKINETADNWTAVRITQDRLTK